MLCVFCVLSDPEILIYYGAAGNSGPQNLPVGNENSDNKTTLIMRLYDYINDYTEHVLQIVIVVSYI